MKRPTQKVFQKQLTVLRTVETDLVKAGKPLTNQNLLTGLETKGLKNINRNQLYYLKKALGENNGFVLSIAESQYSPMVEDIYNKILLIEDKCFELAGNDWTQHETETSVGDGDRDSYTRTKTTDNEYKPQHDFYKLALDCQTAKTKILSGDVINVSVAMIERNFNRLRDEKEEYLRENLRLKDRIEKLEKDNGSD